MKYQTDQERLIRKIIEWSESLSEEEIREYMKDSEDKSEDK